MSEPSPDRETQEGRRRILLTEAGGNLGDLLLQARQERRVKREGGAEAVPVHSKKHYPDARIRLKRFHDKTWSLNLDYPQSGLPIVPDNDEDYAELLLATSETFQLDLRYGVETPFEHSISYYLHPAEISREFDNLTHPAHNKRRELLEQAGRRGSETNWSMYDPDPDASIAEQFKAITADLRFIGT